MWLTIFLRKQTYHKNGINYLVDEYSCLHTFACIEIPRKQQQRKKNVLIRVADNSNNLVGIHFDLRLKQTAFHLMCYDENWIVLWISAQTSSVANLFAQITNAHTHTGRTEKGSTKVLAFFFLLAVCSLRVFYFTIVTLAATMTTRRPRETVTFVSHIFFSLVILFHFCFSFLFHIKFIIQIRYKKKLKKKKQKSSFGQCLLSALT